MPIIVDSSVAAAWALPDEFSTIANRALELVAADGMLVPGLFWYELRNVLVVNERRKRIDETRTNQALGFIQGLAWIVDAEFENDALMALARRHDLTVYDAAYLELALRKRSVLASLDRPLIDAAIAEGVKLVSGDD